MDGLVLDDERIMEIAAEGAEKWRPQLVNDGNSEEKITDILKGMKRDIFNSLKQFNDDFKVFLSDTNSDDELQVILRGHLYIEREITGMLCLTLENPDEILSDRFMFMNKVNLAIALGIIPKEDRSVLSKINSLRNKLAHNLYFTCDEKDYTGLKDSFRGELKKMKDHVYVSRDEEDLLIKMKNLIGIVWVYVKHERILVPLKLKNEALKKKSADLSLELREAKKKLSLLRQDTNN